MNGVKSVDQSKPVQILEEVSSFITSTGATIFYRDFQPEGTPNFIPLMCLHGFLRNSRDFVEFGELMAKRGVRVIAPDLRGRGFSEWFNDSSQYHYDLIKRDVVELLDHLQIMRVALLGIALGALISIDLAAEEPQRVKGIVLNDQGTEVNKQSASKMASNVEAASYTFDEAVERMKLHFGDTYPGLSHERWVNLTLRAYRDHKPGEYARDLDLSSMADVPRLAAERPDLWKHFLATVGTPVAILRGALSTYFSADCADRMVASHPKASLTTIEGRGHPPLLDEQASLEAIFELLEKASAEQPT
ncbi:alpha/beta fold hydrolase [Pseudomonas mediterranea]|uniref:alpha/beta fold hydrolase n=2 Tax=Pseudomonas mediterranea TaxID=183795 RepID=UPI0006D8C4CA|nr:alpha/beta hydrolase [Pseudomonas mediterranea]MDU9027490.1 alpha/beta hydrolase [Pseudomonas mediterranea]